jgi:hypothetical protein
MSMIPKDRSILIIIITAAIVIMLILYALNSDASEMGGMNKVQGYSLPSLVNMTHLNV